MDWSFIEYVGRRNDEHLEVSQSKAESLLNKDKKSDENNSQ